MDTMYTNSDDRSKRPPRTRALGWFSIALGASELLAPSRVARLVGATNRPMIIRGLGARELMSGLGILRGKSPSRWVKSRVAGDIMDLPLLGLAFTGPGARPERLSAATAAVAGVTALDIIATRESEAAA